MTDSAEREREKQSIKLVKTHTHCLSYNIVCVLVYYWSIDAQI